MDLLAALAEDFVIGDGGVGTLLQNRGLTASESGELWNVTHPAEVEAAHRAFVEAGSELIQTNTFQANPISLRRHGLEGRVAELNRAGAEIARRAAGREIIVVGSIGPIGELLEPYGELTAAAAGAAFAEQARALAAGGVDGFFVETFTSIEEAELAVSAAKATDLPVAASLAFQASGATVMGVKPEQAVTQLSRAGADIIGANCGVGPAELFPILQHIVYLSDGPTLAQPNAGLPQLVAGKTVFPETPETMAEYACRFRDLGVNIIGGCCGTRPEHIRAMAKELRGALL